VETGKVVIIGGGIVGTNAGYIHRGRDARRCTLLDRSADRLRELDEIFGNGITTAYSSVDAIENHAAIA